MELGTSNNYDRAVEVLSKLINLRAIGNQKRLEFDELVLVQKLRCGLWLYYYLRRDMSIIRDWKYL